MLVQQCYITQIQTSEGVIIKNPQKIIDYITNLVNEENNLKKLKLTKMV